MAYDILKYFRCAEFRRQSLVHLVKREVSYSLALGKKSFILRQVFKVADHLASLALP